MMASIIASVAIVKPRMAITADAVAHNADAVEHSADVARSTSNGEVGASPEGASDVRGAGLDTSSELDPRSQYPLVDEMVSALSAPWDEQDGAMLAVRRAWSARRFRWEMLWIPAMCASHDQCHFAFFDWNRVARRNPLSFLPEITMAESEWRALRARCEAFPRGCVVTLEFELRELDFDGDGPPALFGASGVVQDARSVAADEYFLTLPPRFFRRD